jgi:hypothetical protein
MTHDVLESGGRIPRIVISAVGVDKCLVSRRDCLICDKQDGGTHLTGSSVGPRTALVTRS